MKKLFSFLLAAGFLVSCGSDGTSNADTGAESAPVTPGIDNVNGNVPDTSETMRLNRPLPMDSTTGKDSTSRTR